MPIKMLDEENKKNKKNPMQEDRAREGKKAKYRKMGFGDMIDSGEIDFGDKHPLTKKRLKNFKKKEDSPMSDERFFQQRKEALKKSGVKVEKFSKGGRAAYKDGSKGCKMATKGKGRAYGKNS
jgi:hypothetical protein